ncbi:MAG: PAS domain S-box protein [Bacillota bacterium]
MIEQIEDKDLHRLFLLFPEMFSISGYDGIIKHLSPAWETILGYSVEELSGRPFSDLIYPEDLDQTWREIQKIAEGGRIHSFTNRFLCKDGSVKWLLWSAVSYPEEKLIYATARDVTDKIQAEEALKESQRRMVTLMNSFPGMAYRVRMDTDWIMEYVSDGCYQLTGYFPDELTEIYNISFGSLIYYEDRTITYEAFNKAVENKEPYKVLYRMYTANKEIKWVWEQGQAIYSPEGNLEGIEGFITDITQYKKAEEEQERLNRALKAITMVNQTIIRGTDEKFLLDEVCQIICNIEGYQMAWVGFMEYDSDKTIKPVAWKGKEEGYLKHFKLSWGNNYMGQGPTGVCIRAKKPAIMHDIEKDMPTQLFKQAAKQRGYASIFCAPLMEDGNPFGVLAIYANRTDIFTSAEQSLLEQLANDLSFGICTLRSRSAREKAEGLLRESESRYRALVESSPIGIGIQRDYKWIYVNPATVKIFNVDSADDIIGKPVNAFGNLPEEEKQMILKRVDQITLGTPLEPYEFSAVFPGGREAIVQANSVQIIYEGAPAVLTLLKDVTEQKIAERKLKASSQELRQLAAHLQAAREEERTYIAREIHDELGQCLTGMKIDASFLEDLINDQVEEKSAAALLEKVHSLSGLIDTTVKSVRKIASELRPAILDSMGLSAAIEWLTDDFQNRIGIPCEAFVTVQDIKLDKEKSTAVFRILQESLTNIMRHANASRVTVSFIEEDCNYIMEIKDNGKGITEEDFKKAKSFGLLGMKERAILFGGTTDINSIPGRGTTITVTIPAVKA